MVRHLPAELVTLVAGEQAEGLLADLADWGQVTTIVESEGSIFEVKAPFPKGKNARGYYNLMGRDGEMHGHLKLDNVMHVWPWSASCSWARRVTPSSSLATLAAASSRSIWGGMRSASCSPPKSSVSWPYAISIKRKSKHE
ncbi:HuvX protein [Aeromonas molluscorum 848]|uniref:HuvX protein n=1 Tax=Aeromonas molluscorum 848 TaxID=1268236 RepID=R1HD71_9GAMM|nr:HuvX protein [Aeromonas molluscorum 848]